MDDLLSELEQPPRTGLSPLWLIAIAVSASCLFYIGDRLYTRYQQHQALNSLEQTLQTVLDQSSAAAARLATQASSSTRRSQQHIERLRQQRMTTTEGRWLGKNCADWTEAWNQTKAPTARDEMRKHCRLYEQYLATGAVPPGTPRGRSSRASVMEYRGPD
ncbi:MAG: hypothetical protein Kow0020_07770 [Wenzhouxiangellaceae bacterium]